MKNFLGGANATLSVSPVAYPRPMAEMVEYLILLQTQGTAPSKGKTGNLLRLCITLSEDPYCLGYLAGMFDCLCHQWEVPVTERRLVIGSATNLMFRDLLDTCGDPHRAAAIEDAAFNGMYTLASDPEFVRGKFDGCSELMRYTATKDAADMPAKLHDRLRYLAEAA